MAIINHDDNVKIVLLNSKTASGDRNAILEVTDESPVIVSITFTEPILGSLESYGDCSIVGKVNEDDFSNGCNVTAVAMYKGSILPEAVKLALKEVFTVLNKNKVKVDIVYINDISYNMRKIEAINLTLIIQNIMKDYKCNASLWLESIKSDDATTLSLNTKEPKQKKEKKDKKDKKKKKKDKKKGK